MKGEELCGLVAGVIGDKEKGWIRSGLDKNKGEGDGV